MPLKNYTSSVPVDKTIARIERLLIDFGATGIHKDTAGGAVKALAFALLPEQTGGKEFAIRVPVNAEAVEKILREEVRRPRSGTLDKLHEQALRTAWKLMQDWIEVQLSLVRMGQAEALQVFLPYLYRGGQTFFESIKGGGYKALLEDKRKEI